MFIQLNTVMFIQLYHSNKKMNLMTNERKIRKISRLVTPLCEIKEGNLR